MRVKLARNLKGSELWLARLAGRSSRGSIHPAELASRISAESDLVCRAGPGGMVAPNRFAVRLNCLDLAALPDHRGLIRDLEGMTEATSMTRGRRLEGPVRVWLEPDPAASPGTVEVEASHRRGRRPAWASLVGEGPALEISLNRSVLGRGGKADVVIPHPSISPSHALLWYEAGSVWIRDLGSTHGTFVDGCPVSETTQVLPPGAIRLGAVNYTLRVQ